MPPKKRAREVSTHSQASSPLLSTDTTPKVKRARTKASVATATDSPQEAPTAFTLVKESDSARRRPRAEAESDAGTSSSTKAVRRRLSRSPSAAEEEEVRGDLVLDETGEDIFAEADTVVRVMDEALAVQEQRKTTYNLLVKQLAELREAFSASQARSEETRLGRDPESHCEAVRLNVGGVPFVVPVSTLLARDTASYFCSLLGVRGSVVPVFLDANGDIFIDRDPETFRLVLRYLHGSDHFDMLDEEQLAKLKVDAQYFQLEGLVGLLTDPPKDTVHLLMPGPGVSPEQNRLRVMYCVGIVGDRQLVTGRHRITFEIVASDYAGVGLVSEACITQDQEFHKTLNCCVYYMSGVFYANFPHHRKEETLEKFESGDFVSILVDLDRGFAEFSLKNSTKVVAIGRGRRLRFAATLKLGSRVRIVPESEASQLGLRQPDGATPAHGELQIVSAARMHETASDTR